MAKKEPTPTIEDYLGIIYTLIRDGDEVYGARLADLLAVSAPTVTVTLQRMARDGWIRINETKKVTLTKKGNEVAKSVIRRHMLTEWMLAKILNIPWSKLHEEADRMEHAISNGVEQSMLERFNDPKLCPHGNPMPGSEKESNAWHPLIQCKPGEMVVIRRIHELLEDDLEILKYLETNEVKPGNQFQIEQVDPIKETLTIQQNELKVKLKFQTATYIFIESL